MATNNKFYTWAIRRTESTRAPLWVALLFSLELVLFIPLDAILMFFCLQNRRRIPLYVAIASLASAFSGLLGYLLGHFLWSLVGTYITSHFISAATFEHFASHYQQYENWAIFLGALLPFPLKIVSLSAGIFHLALLPFLTYVLFARTLRFSLVGICMYIWGDKVKALLDKHFRYFMLLLGAKIAIGFGFFWAIAQ